MAKTAVDGLRMMAGEFIENGKLSQKPQASKFVNRALLCTGAANDIIGQQLR